MIRDNNKIYGEVNDPNTVLSSGQLLPDKLVVGNGNKSIKTFDASSNSIIQILNGKVVAFNINMANKIIGTDENGNLALLDYTEGFTRANVFGIENAIESVQSNVVDCNISDIVNNIGYSTFKLNNNSTTGPGNLTIVLNKALDFSDKSNILVVWSSNISKPLFKKISLANDSTETSIISLDEPKSLINFNNMVNITPGIYTKIKIEVDNTIPTFESLIESIMTVMCIIMY